MILLYYILVFFTSLLNMSANMIDDVCEHAVLDNMVFTFFCCKFGFLFGIQFNILLNNSDFLHPKPFLPVNRCYQESSNNSEQETTRCFRIQPWTQQAMGTDNLCPNMVQQTLNVYMNCLRYLWCLENKDGNNK